MKTKLTFLTATNALKCNVTRQINSFVSYVLKTHPFTSNAFPLIVIKTRQHNASNIFKLQ